MNPAATPYSNAPAREADPCLGMSPSLLAAKARVVESGKLPLLLMGETGTGKSNLAHFAHWHLQSVEPTRHRRLIWVNCACQTHETLTALAQQIRETNPREALDLVLEEIGDSSPETQAFWIALWDSNRRHLSALPGPEIRFVATSQQDLGQLTLLGRFRPELFSRLGAAHLYLAPLRNRREDILPLFHALYQKHFGVSADAEVGVLEQLTTLSYRQGNVRELEEITLRLGTHLNGAPITRARVQMVLALGSPVEALDAAVPVDPSELKENGLEDYLDRHERRILEHFLKTERCTMKEISRTLRLSRPTLYRKLKKHGLLPGRLPAR